MKALSCTYISYNIVEYFGPPKFKIRPPWISCNTNIKVTRFVGLCNRVVAIFKIRPFESNIRQKSQILSDLSRIPHSKKKKKSDSVSWCNPTPVSCFMLWKPPIPARILIATTFSCRIICRILENRKGRIMKIGTTLIYITHPQPKNFLEKKVGHLSHFSVTGVGFFDFFIRSLVAVSCFSRSR